MPLAGAAIVTLLLNNEVPVAANALVPIVAPPSASDVPVATPNTGVVSVGVFCITATVPEPVKL